MCLYVCVSVLTVQWPGIVYTHRGSMASHCRSLIHAARNDSSLHQLTPFISPLFTLLRTYTLYIRCTYIYIYCGRNHAPFCRLRESSILPHKRFEKNYKQILFFLSLFLLLFDESFILLNYKFNITKSLYMFRFLQCFRCLVSTYADYTLEFRFILLDSSSEKVPDEKPIRKKIPL